MKLHGNWIKSNAMMYRSDKFARVMKRASVGIKKPVAIEEKKDPKGHRMWRIIYKPIQRGEFWD